jgi:hypothetical protein
MWRLFLLIGLITGARAANAQVKVQLITKKIEKAFPYRSGYEVNVEGEKAEVIVESWDKNEIRVLLELTAQHPDKAVAEKELETVRYLADKTKNKIYLRNYLSKKEGEPEPQSILSARYTIYVPEECPVYVKNYFGVINVSNLFKSVKINSQFSKITLDNVQGLMEVTTRFGDVSGNNLDGDMILNARRSDVTLKNLKGNYNLTTQYGILNLWATKELASLNINAEKSDVFLHGINPGQFAYQLTAQNGAITLPNNLKYTTLQNTKEIKRIQFKPVTEYYATITVSVSFGDIFIGK